jgi:hypothetical protein
MYAAKRNVANAQKRGFATVEKGREAIRNLEKEKENIPEREKLCSSIRENIKRGNITYEIKVEYDAAKNRAAVLIRPVIKGIMEKLSQSENASGQLIFTTHESGLLDQDIFRPDEIWFAQKDAEQATQLYPLSDFNIHKTANIENGYLNGRYGGIPFLSNLKDLHW